MAALAACSRVAPVAVAAAPRLTVSPAALPLLAELRRLEFDVLRYRRDDGDTILEL